MPVSLNGAPTFADITFFNDELIVHGTTAAAVESDYQLYVGSSELPIFVPHDQLYQNGDSVDITAIAASPMAATPEPSSLALLGTGLLGVCGMWKRRVLSEKVSLASKIASAL